MTEPKDGNDNDIAEQLRKLGYLQNPLEKFFVGRMSRKTSIFKTNLIVGLKVGLFGGTVLGLLIGTGTAILDRRLLHPVTNYFVLVALLSVAYAIIACTLGILGAVVLTIWSTWRKKVVPRVRLAAIRAGMLGSVVTFIYLTLQWQRLRVHTGDTASVSLTGLGALAFILFVALVIGRMVFLAVLVILCRAQKLPLEEHAHPARAYATAAVLLLAVTLFFVTLFVLADHPAPEADPFTRATTGTPVVLIALDGVPYQSLEQMRDRMPTLATLAEAGTHVRLEKSGNPVPASVWTSVATGVTPEVHGVRTVAENHIHGLTTVIHFDQAFAGFDEAINYILPFFRLARQVPASSASTDLKSVWHIAAEHRLRVGVVNWWLSSPAEEVPKGFIIGDGAYGALLTAAGAEDNVHPDTLAEALKPLTLKPDAGDLDEPLRRAYATDKSNLLYALKAFDTPDKQPDLLALSFSGIDVLEHKLEENNVTPAVRAKALADYSRYLDAMIEKVVSRCNENTVFVIVGDPGLPGSDKTESGFLILSGGVCRPDEGPLKSATLYDIAPTVLYLLGMPKSDEMPGQILLAGIAKSFKEEYETGRRHTIRSYGRKPRPGEAPDPDRQRRRLDDLRNLGYLK